MKATLVLPLLLRLAVARPVSAVDEVQHPNPDVPTASLPVLNGAGPQPPIDNRPQRPAGSAVPSVVLASPSPLETTFLLSLPRKGHKKEEEIGMTVESVGSSSRAAAAPTTRERETGRYAQQGHHSHTTTDHACHRAYMAYHRQFDIAIVGLVALFLAVIVKAESRGSRGSQSSETSTGIEESTEGVIRLQIDQPTTKQPLSINAWAEHDSERVVSEKSRQ